MVETPLGPAPGRRVGGDIVVVPVVDRELNDRKFIVPGLGDFGDRLYGTT